MRTLVVVLIWTLTFSGWLGVRMSFAHGDGHHEKCKKGYVRTKDHRCVRTPQIWRLLASNARTQRANAATGSSRTNSSDKK